VVVDLRGTELDRVSFESSEEAEGYKRGVRRWAREKGIIVGVRSERPEAFWPTSAQAGAV
jgi:hypothetical protein